MSRNLTLIILFAFLTLGWIAELSAQVPSPATSATRRANMFNSSRVGMFSSSGGLNAERGNMKSKSLLQTDPLMDLLSTNDPSMTLQDPLQPNMNLFATVGGGLQRLMGLQTTPTPTGSVTGGLITGDVTTDDVNTTLATSTIRQTGMYAPRLRFVPNQEDLEELQKPEVIAQLEDADRKRAAELVADINDKFALPQKNITLEFDGLTAVIQGRVPSPTVRKQIELYLGFEPGIYSVKNVLVVDPSILEVAGVAMEPTLPTTHSDLAP